MPSGGEHWAKDFTLNGLEEFELKSCLGCARRENNKCTVMTILPKSRICYATLDQAIETEMKIIDYIDFGNYPSHEKEDVYYRTIAVKRLEKLKQRRLLCLNG